MIDGVVLEIIRSLSLKSSV